MAAVRETVLIITASESFAGYLEKLLGESGFATAIKKDIADGIAEAKLNTPSLILVDRSLVGHVEQLRKDAALRSVPITTVQQPGMACTEDECLDDLTRGVDYALCNQPAREVVARIRAIVRREGLLAMMAERYVVGNLIVDTVQHEVMIDGKPVELTPKEFQILLQLVQHPAKVFSRDELLDLIWGKGYALEQHTLDVHIHSLRHKIEPDPSAPKFIVTVRGIGYKLKSQ